MFLFSQPQEKPLSLDLEPVPPGPFTTSTRALPDEFQILLFSIEPPDHLWGELVHFLVFVSHPTDHRRLVKASAVENHRHEPLPFEGALRGHIPGRWQRRSSHRLPGDPEPLQFPLTRGDEPFFVKSKLKFRTSPQSAHLRVASDCVDSESFSELVEVNVARFNQSPVEVDSSMSLLPPASMNVRSHCKGAVAKDLFVGINNPFSRPARAITILKVDPGGYCPAIALFWRDGLCLRSNSSTVPCRRPAEIDWDQRQGYSPWRGSPRYWDLWQRSHRLCF